MFIEQISFLFHRRCILLIFTPFLFTRTIYELALFGMLLDVFILLFHDR